MSNIKDKRTRESIIIANADMTRSNLQNTYHIDGESDSQIIRAALNQLAQLNPIVRYHDLVLLHWVTILIEQLPADHPDFRGLYKSWYDAKVRTRKVI